MFRKQLGAVLTATLLSGASLSYAGISVMDGFEAGKMTALTGPAPAVNTAGLIWESPTYTSVVNSVHKDGAYSLQFTYAAGKFWSEQRFNMATAYRDIWIRYWLRVPTNYTHDTTSTGNNRKLFALWMDDYSAKGNGPTIAWEFWGDGKGGSSLAVHYSVGGYTGGGKHLQLKPFITTADRGRWMEIVLHATAATTTSSNDGVIETWRRWDGESNFTKLHDLRNEDIGAPSTGPNGWKKGYLMGWANAAYATDTFWHVDNFTVSNESLLSATTTTPTPTSSPPSAPVLKVQ